MMQKRRQVVCAIVERDLMLLAACRNKGQSNGGLWEFPGGKVHRGETLVDALHREIREELDIAITIHRELPPVIWDYPWIAIELFPFICSINGDREPNPVEHAAIRFVSPEEAFYLSWAPADRIVVERYCADARSTACRKVVPKVLPSV